jgi:hypothetical protein
LIVQFRAPKLLIGSLLGAFIIAVGILIGVYLAHQYPGDSAQAHTDQQTDHSGWHEWLGLPWDAWVAIATFMLFAATFFLFLVTLKGIRDQTKLTRDSIKLTGDQLALARDEFNASHRPRIRIKHVWLRSEIWGDKKVVVDLVVVNSGDAPAIIIQRAMSTLMISADDTLPNGHDNWIISEERNELGIGRTISFVGLTDGRVISDADNASLRDGKKFLFCLGSIDYIDKTEPAKLMKTAFCRRLRMASQMTPGAMGRADRFIRYEDPDYEYED